MRLKRFKYSFSAIFAGFKVFPRSYYPIVFLVVTNFCLNVTLFMLVFPKLFAVWLRFGLVAPKLATLLVFPGVSPLGFLLIKGCGVFLPSSDYFRGANLDDLTLFC